jgi:hypothetical protein
VSTLVNRCKLAATGVGLAATVGAIAYTSPATADGGATLRVLCTPSHLTASMSLIRGSAGAGNIGYKLGLKNTGSAACALGNHPGLKLLGQNGQKLPTHVMQLGTNEAVTIASGHTATARLRFSPDLPGKGEPGKGPCEPAAHKVRVILRRSVSLVGPVKPPTSVCEHGRIQEQPLG